MNRAAIFLLIANSCLVLLSSPASAKPAVGQSEQTASSSISNSIRSSISRPVNSAEAQIAAAEHARLEGNYPQAQRQIKLGLSQILNSKNPSPERLAAAYNYLALLNNSMGQYADSESNARKALSFGSKAGLSENILARHRVVLANALRQQGKYREAQSNLEKAIATLKASNPDKALFATATNNLGALYFWMGYYHKALVTLERGLALRLALAGGDKQNLDVANSYLDLGCTEYKLGHKNEAIARVTQALSIRKKILGDDHPETLNAMANVATLLISNGGEANEIEAARLLKAAVASASKKLAANHPDLIYYQQQYAIVLTDQASRFSLNGFSKEAIETIKKAIKLREVTSNTLGRKDISYAVALANGAAIYKRAHKGTEAKNMMTEAICVLDSLPMNEQQSADGKAIRQASQERN